MSKTLVDHFENLCRVIRFKKRKGTIVDIGSNDGTLLRFFKQKGFKVLGVDPAEKIAEVATQGGINTLPIEFNSKVAKKIVKKYGKADIITATNVFAHIENLYDIYRGVETLLKDDGFCAVEVSYLLDMVQKSLFDSIYHEHLYFFAVKPLVFFFNNTNLELFDVERIPMHGGSLRLWIRKRRPGKKRKLSQKIRMLINEEERCGLDDIATFQRFKDKIEIGKHKLLTLLKKIKREQKSIVGFGAPAKGNILLNYFGINSSFISYVADSTSYKQFRFTPGTHLQVLPEETIYIDKPDYLLILAWNFTREIINKHKSYKGKFIIPLPKVKII